MTIDVDAVELETTTSFGEGKETLEQQLSGFPIYKQYNKLYQEFIAQNKETLSIKERIAPNLTGSTLSGPEKIEYRSPTLYFISDTYFASQDEIALETALENNNDDDDANLNSANYSITFLYLGDKVSGHHGIVHGGLLATLLDEITCRLAFLNFPSKKGFTANLNIDYKKPTVVDSWVCIKCTTLKKQGRKCWVRGEVYVIDPDTESLAPSQERCVGKVLIIEPKVDYQ
ncbi:hypothetical protein KGF56_002710 [Candida oxycetoniae]|uniref:Thioesterase domain-containing protein n=1 Tax=Candida oxycetoniae TaxID=497107 RepID=A0AAI9SX03_9ASCO|nr:uncharacterized protein KGF56_002710 [Candida oxycetoniae]KAI3404518.2 hypothetical protein KGF56_002710 [Candida oxycetoniae]